MAHFLLNGHHRATAAYIAGANEIDVTVVDLDEIIRVKGLSKGCGRNSIDFNTVCSDDRTKMTPTEILDISDIQAEMYKFARSHKKYFAHGYKRIEAVSIEKNYMSTNAEGVIRINFADDDDGFNAGKELITAIEKIKKRAELAPNEEYAMECLWHEVLHNRSKNKYDLPGWYESFERVSVETINQLVARHTYPEFLSSFGIEPKHQEWILNNGYGYNQQVANLRLLLKSTNINEDEFVAEIQKSLFKSYKKFDEVVIELLKKKYKSKGNIEWAFKHIDEVGYEEYLKDLKILP